MIKFLLIWANDDWTSGCELFDEQNAAVLERDRMRDKFTDKRMIDILRVEVVEVAE